jgi:hypothetical protein
MTEKEPEIERLDKQVDDDPWWDKKPVRLKGEVDDDTWWNQDEVPCVKYVPPPQKNPPLMLLEGVMSSRMGVPTQQDVNHQEQAVKNLLAVANDHNTDDWNGRLAAHLSNGLISELNEVKCPAKAKGTDDCRCEFCVCRAHFLNCKKCQSAGSWHIETDDDSGPAAKKKCRY